MMYRPSALPKLQRSARARARACVRVGLPLTTCDCQPTTELLRQPSHSCIPAWQRQRGYSYPLVVLAQSHREDVSQRARRSVLPADDYHNRLDQLFRFRPRCYWRLRRCGGVWLWLWLWLGFDRLCRRKVKSHRTASAELCRPLFSALRTFHGNSAAAPEKGVLSVCHGGAIREVNIAARAQLAFEGDFADLKEYIVTSRYRP